MKKSQKHIAHFPAGILRLLYLLQWKNVAMYITQYILYNVSVHKMTKGWIFRKESPI